MKTLVIGDIYGCYVEVMKFPEAILVHGFFEPEIQIEEQKVLKTRLLRRLLVGLILVSGGFLTSRVWPLAWLLGVPMVLLGFVLFTLAVLGLRESTQTGNCPRCGGDPAVSWRGRTFITIVCKKCGSYDLRK